MIKKRLASLFMTSAMLCGFGGWLPAGYGGLDISASASGSIEAALQWAVAAANDDSHGYSQSNRWGPDYDCSSFVITALRSAGFETSSASYTGNMRKDLIANGFTWIPWSSIGSEGNLQRGDILLKEGSHTEFYLGNGKNVGAHKDYGHPESGDQTGGEVSVSGYYYHPWDGVLRYEASSSPIGCVDVLETRGSEVHVAGWAFDPDNPNANLQIHVYAGSKGVNEIVANLESSDVNAVYNISGKHRFDKWLNMGVSGTQTVSVYAIDATGDGNTKIDETSLYFGAMSASLDADFKALIVNTNSNKPIMQDNNGNVVLTTEARTNYDATLWHFLKNDDGTYSIYSYKNGSRRGYAMGVTNNSDTNGAKIICSTPNLSGVNQKWRIDVRTSDGTMKLVPKCSSTDKCLEISGGGKTDGTAAQIRTADGTAPQKFKFIKLDANRDKIDYRLSTSSTSVIQNSNVKITVGGTTPYVCEYKFCVTDPNGKETTVNNGCNPVYSFNPSITGNYKVYALLKNPVQESIAANAKNKAVTIKVTCAHSYKLQTVAPTCTAQGYTTHTCAKCGDTFKDNYTATVSHKYTSSVTTEATCTKTGVRTYTCSVCKNSYTEAIPAKGHSYTSKVTKEPTCTDNGIKTYTCSCGSSYTENIPPSGHKFGEKVVDPTTTEQGYTLHTCSVCGYEYKDNIIEPLHTHSYTSEITKAATCTEDGIITYTCECGESYTEAIPATGHDFREKVVPPTTTEYGYTLHTCTVCGYFYEDNPVEPLPAPKVPTLTATANEKSVVLKWNPISTAEKYGIAAYTNGKWNLLDECYTISYELKNLKPGTEYKVAVVVMYDDKWNMDFSNAVNVALEECTVPKISYEKDTDSIKLTWTAVRTAEKYGIFEFEDDYWNKIGQTSDTCFVINGLAEGSEHKIAVVTYSEGKWNTDFSNAVTVTLNKPNAGKYPVVTSEVSGRQFRLKWTAVSGAEKYGIAVYQSGGWRVKVQVKSNTTSYTSPKMKSGTYKMVVCAKINGNWDTSSLKSRAFNVKIA